MWQYERDGGKLFPLKLDFMADETFVNGSAPFGVPDGSRLLTVNDIPAAALRARIVACTSAPTPLARRLFASDRYATAMWVRALLGPRREFTVSYEAAGRTTRTSVGARSWAEIAKCFPRQDSGPVAFRFLANETVGYLDYRRSEKGSALEAGLHDAFTRVKEAQVRALVVDVRRNGGGSDGANDQALNYLTGKTYSQGNRYSVRSSSMVKSHYGFVGYVKRYFAPNAWFAPEGAVVEITVPEFLAQTRPGSNPLRYGGPIFLLVGAATFSSAAGFAETVQNYGIATLAGETLGEPVDSNGEVFNVRAPRTCLNAGIASKFFYGSKARPDGSRVTPDIRIEMTASDVRAGRDPVLAAVLERVKGA